MFKVDCLQGATNLAYFLFDSVSDLVYKSAVTKVYGVGAARTPQGDHLPHRLFVSCEVKTPVLMPVSNAFFAVLRRALYGYCH